MIIDRIMGPAGLWTADWMVPLAGLGRYFVAWCILPLAILFLAIKCIRLALLPRRFHRLATCSLLLLSIWSNAPLITAEPSPSPLARPDPLPAVFQVPDVVRRVGNHAPAQDLPRAKSSARLAQALSSLLPHAIKAGEPIPGLPSSHLNTDDPSLELLDIVLVSTVDGRLHAVERSTGRLIWTQANLILNDTERTLVSSRSRFISNASDLVQQVEPMYIVEPNDGSLYVYLPDGSDAVAGWGEFDGRLQKLPLTMEELIDLSPFTFPHEASHIFMGSKSSSLLAIDLQTGERVSDFAHDANCDFSTSNEVWASPPECESDIELRPEDKLFIGRTEFQLSVHSHQLGLIQQLRHVQLVPNAVHRDLAEHWKRSGQLRGEVIVRNKEGGRYQGTLRPTEFENRWRVEMMHDGTIIGFEQEKGMKWHLNLGSLAVSVFDVLLPTAHGSQPILLPQPPAHVPALFPSSQHNLELSSLPPATYLAPANMVDTTNLGWTPSLDVQQPPTPPPHTLAEGVFAMSSQNYPLINFAPRARKNDLVGTHIVVDAVKERLPYLLDPPKDEESQSKNNVPAEGVQSLKGHRNWWLALPPMALALILAAFYLFRTRTPAVTMEPAKPVIQVEKPLPAVPPSELATNEVLAAINGNGLASDKAGNLVGVPPENGVNLDLEKKGRKKTNGRRRKRGKKKSKAGGGESSDDTEMDEGESASPSDTGVVVEKSGKAASDLMVTDEILGLGSQGTVVYKGVFQGRAVAVKRLLKDFVTVAHQEVSLLQASDDHQNVVRYYYQERRDNFLFIALELCPASLADVIERSDSHQDLAVGFNPKKALSQVTSGLRHLHSLKIVHRDLKPQNVLISVGKNGAQRMLLSDFGLAKRLEYGVSSYAQTGKFAVGSVGWRAPECLKGEVQLDDLQGESSEASSSGGGEASTNRLTKAVDLFALGCLYFYVLTSGGHPFGDRFEREINIVRNAKTCVDKLLAYGEDGFEAKHLVERLLSPEPKERPDTLTCLTHPLFWTTARRLNFLCDASDRFEVMELDPPEPTLVLLESRASSVIGGQSWLKKLDNAFVENLGKQRKYQGGSLRDLLRALRNKKNHYQDLPESLKRRLGPLPSGFLNYFSSRFPSLFIEVHDLVQHSKLKKEQMFLSYFELEDG